MLEGWLSQPHWREWWGEAEEELRLIYAIEEGEHLPFIACINNEPIAYIQCWWPASPPRCAMGEGHGDDGKRYRYFHR